MQRLGLLQLMFLFVVARKPVFFQLLKCTQKGGFVPHSLLLLPMELKHVRHGSHIWGEAAAKVVTCFGRRLVGSDTAQGVAQVGVAD